ncbi:MAG: YIP1 family protein [Candidatus Aenigmatarchaeota archaeon]
MSLVSYLKNPSQAVEELKQKTELKTMQNSLVMVFVSAVLFAVNSYVGLNLLENMGLEITGPELLVSVLEMGTVNLATGSFFLIFLGGLFFGYLMKVVLNVLGGEGDYWDGLTTIAYPVFSVSLGILLAMIFSYVPTVGPALAFIFVAVFFAIGYSSMFRLAKEMFDVGMIEAFIGVTVVLAVGLVAIYGGLLTTPEGVMAVIP